MSEQARLLGGRYEVGELVGRGGMAEVHRGVDLRLKRPVAIKMLRSDLARDASFLTRFRREAQSSAGLNHASIVAVYDSGEDQGVDSHGRPHNVPFIVMEYVEGKTLREVLNQRGKLTSNEAARITEGVLDALAYSHRMGIVHRDIKPANVMIGADNTVKVMDFGIARAIADTNATMTQTQAVIGTAQYLSPEQAQGQNVDARSDLYSTGCMLYELLTGRPPFQGDSPVAIAYQHVGQPPAPPSTVEESVGPDMDAVVLHALNKDRAARYQSAADFRADLQAVRLGRPISDAARGTAAGAAAAGATATEVIGRLGSEPTEVYAAQPRQGSSSGGAGAGGAGAGGAGAGAVGAGAVGAAAGGPGGGGSGAATGGSRPSGATGDTSSFPAVREGRDRQPDRRGTWAILTIAGLIALALLGWGLNSYLDNQAQETAMVTVPSVTGEPRATAQAKITRAGLTPEVTTENSKTVPADHVISQDPEGAVRVAKGRTVKLVVSAGPEAVTIPDLVGKTEAEARQVLGDLGLTVGEVTPENDTKKPKGQVVSSSPASGDAVAPGTAVALKLSSGQVTVPDLVGKTQNEAFTLLTEAGLTPKSAYKQTADAAEGTVLEQDKKAGDVVDAASVVLITIAQASPPTPTPSASATPTPSASVTPTPASPSPSVSPS